MSQAGRHCLCPTQLTADVQLILTNLWSFAGEKKICVVTSVLQQGHWLLMVVVKYLIACLSLVWPVCHRGRVENGTVFDYDHDQVDRNIDSSCHSCFAFLCMYASVETSNSAFSQSGGKQTYCPRSSRNKIQTYKRFKRTLICYATDTQSAHFWGNPLGQGTKWHLNYS